MTRPAGRTGSVSVEIVRAGPGRLALRGALTFASARRAYEAGMRAFGAESERTLEIDCAGVTAGDSAGLAVLLCWLAWGAQRGTALRFSTLPEAIRAMARISEVESLLEDPAARGAPLETERAG